VPGGRRSGLRRGRSDSVFAGCDSFGHLSGHGSPLDSSPRDCPVGYEPTVRSSPVSRPATGTHNGDCLDPPHDRTGRRRLVVADGRFHRPHRSPDLPGGAGADNPAAPQHADRADGQAVPRSSGQGQGTRCQSPRLAAGQPPRVYQISPVAGQATLA